MGLKAVSDAVLVMNGTKHHFSDEEREFVVQFAFKSGSREQTNKLIDELAKTDNEADSREIMIRFKAECGVQPAWIEEIENLLVALEMYRIEQERAVRQLSVILSGYGIVMPEDEIRQMKTEEIETVIKKRTEAR